jgi:hypothetical protein
MIASPERPAPESEVLYPPRYITCHARRVDVTDLGAPEDRPASAARADLVAWVVGVQPVQWGDRRAGVLNGAVDSLIKLPIPRRKRHRHPTRASGRR